MQKQHDNMVAKAMAAQQQQQQHHQQHQQQQQQQHQQSKQHMYKLPVELQNMINFYTPTKDILQSREAQEMLMGMSTPCVIKL